MPNKRDQPKVFDPTRTRFEVVTQQYPFRAFDTQTEVEAELWLRLGYQVNIWRWNGSHFERIFE